MGLKELIPLAIKLSMDLIVMALGLRATAADLVSLARRPGFLLRSILAMNVLLPAFAVWLAMSFGLDRAVQVALVALALSPVPPILPTKQTKAGGSSSTAVGLLVAAAVLSIVVVPIGIRTLDAILGGVARVPPERVVPVVLASVLVPLAIGVAVRAVAPAFAARIAKPAALSGMVVLVAAFLPVLVADWKKLVGAVGTGMVGALAAFTVVGVAVGHLLGGPDPDDRTDLALACGTRHPGVALAIAGAADTGATGVFPVVIWHVFLSGLVAIPYVRWQRSRHAAREGDAPA